MKGSDESSTPQEGQGDLIMTKFVFFPGSCIFLLQNAYRSELIECDEYSTPSLITVPAWSTCDSCGESDEDSTPSSSSNPPDRDFRSEETWCGNFNKKVTSTRHHLTKYVGTLGFPVAVTNTRHTHANPIDFLNQDNSTDLQ